MKRRFIFSLLVCFPLLMCAADLPDVVNQNNSYTRQMCIKNNYNNCMNTQCLNSGDRHCSDDCQTAAQNKCKLLSE